MHGVIRASDTTLLRDLFLFEKDCVLGELSIPNSGFISYTFPLLTALTTLTAPFKLRVHAFPAHASDVPIFSPHRYVFVLISPAIRSKLFPSGCKSMYSTPWPPPPPHPLRSGSVRSSPWSGVMPTMRTFRGGVTVVSVTSWSLRP